MSNLNAILFMLVLLPLAALLKPVAERLSLPYPVLLIIAGFIGSEITTRVFGLDTGIRWENFQSIIFYAILPVLIYQSALKMDLRLLRDNLMVIMILSLPLMLLSTAVIAIGLYTGINHPAGFPWLAALLAGALLSATDPAAVISLFEKMNVPTRLRILLDGESLFNDATAIVLYSILIGMTVSSPVTSGIEGLFGVVMNFLSIFLGGVAVGVMTGMITQYLNRLVRDVYLQLMVTTCCVYLTYILAEVVLKLSGVMAVLAAGLVPGYFGWAFIKENRSEAVNQVWEFLSSIAEALIFVLAGVTITWTMFSDQWFAMMVGIASVLAARFLTIYTTFPVINFFQRKRPVSPAEQFLLSWGGVRGTVTLALALSLPVSLDYWYTIQSVAYGVVLFTLFVQTTTMVPLLKRIRL